MTTDVAKGVDQVEWHSIKYGSANCDHGMLDEQVAGAAELDDFSDPHAAQEDERFISNDIVGENFSGKIQEKIKERKDIMQDAYPFNLDGNKLSYVGMEDSCLLYEFLLLASMPQAPLYQDIPRCFERVAAEIVAVYFGRYAKSYHVGFPREGSNFKDAMVDLNKNTEEFSWCPEEEAKNPGRVKDKGLDFVVHMKHADDRSAAQLFILGQCACGQNWSGKLKDLSLPQLEQWFNPMSIVPPVKAFALPHYIEKEKVVESSRDGGLIFDRVRIVNIISNSGKQDLIKELFSKNDWARKILCFIKEHRGSDIQ